MKSIFSAFFAFLLSFNCLSQTKTIVCKVLSSTDQKPIKYATVRINGTSSSTTTNFHGYFQLELAKDYDELVITKKGYKPSSIKIPESNRFRILLNPEIIKLKSLNLKLFLEDSLAYEKSNSSDETLKSIACNYEVTYRYGWNKFYSDLCNYIVFDERFTHKDFNATTNFTISEQGEIINIKISPDTISNKDLIIRSFKKMTNWIITAENNDQVARNFEMHVVLAKKIYHPDEEQPQPFGGMAEFYKHIQTKLKYPAEARRMGIEGKVFVQFNVNSDGTLTDFKVVKGIGSGCNEEALRAVASYPKWKPGQQFGSSVAVTMVLPITFSLGHPKTYSLPNKTSSSFVLSGISVVALGLDDPKESIRSSNFERAEFPGGRSKYNTYIKKHKKNITHPIPPNIQNNNVHLVFTVDEVGQIRNIKVTKSLAPAFDEEAVRLYSTMPPWTPGRLNGKPTEQSITANVYFGNISDNKIQSSINHFQKGIELYTKGKLDKAIEKFTLAIEDNPTQADFYYNRAAVLIQLNKKSAACKDLELIKDIDQEALDIYRRLCQGASIQENIKEEVENEEKWFVVDLQPSFPGGLKEFYAYVNRNLIYPTDAKKQKIEGRVMIEFVVDSTGFIRTDSTKIIQSLYKSCDNEAIRLINESPKWKPGRVSLQNKNVPVRMIMPIDFKRIED